MNLAVETENSIVLVSGLIIYTLNPRSVFKYDVFGKIRGWPIGWVFERVGWLHKSETDWHQHGILFRTIGGGRASGFPPLLLPSPAPPPLYLHNHPLLPLPKTARMETSVHFCLLLIDLHAKGILYPVPLDRRIYVQHVSLLQTWMKYIYPSESSTRSVVGMSALSWEFIEPPVVHITFSTTVTTWSCTPGARSVGRYVHGDNADNLDLRL